MAGDCDRVFGTHCSADVLSPLVSRTLFHFSVFTLLFSLVPFVYHPLAYICGLCMTNMKKPLSRYNVVMLFYYYFFF